MAGFDAGDRLLTGFITLLQADSTGTTTLPTTAAIVDIAGASLTFDVAGDHAQALVIGAFDFSKTGNKALATGYLNVDGVRQTKQAKALDDVNTITDRQDSTQLWSVPLAAGSHTLKLQGSRTAPSGDGTCNANSPGTCITVLLLDIP